MTNVYNNKKKVEENFISIFNNKGIFAAVAEKSYNNYRSKYRKNNNTQPNLHYFAIGHTFKNIDTNKIFDYKISDDEKDMIPTKYLSLQQNHFHFGSTERNTIDKNGKEKKRSIENLLFLIKSIRNINAHFIHDFEYLKIDNIDNRIITFIKESFEVALIHGIYTKNLNSYREEQKKKKKQKENSVDSETKEIILKNILNNKDYEIIKFMQSIFYQTLYEKDEQHWGNNKNYYKEKKTFLDIHLKTKADWIDWILFNNVENEWGWELNPEGNNERDNHKHKVLTIPKGKYLSFEGCLFVLSMFLYANEANYLIPKLKGYKKTEGNNSVKLEVFRFFAKKFKSQDIDSEHNNLVKFRDIVQYIGKFPVKWNYVLHHNIPYVNEFKNYIIENEIKRTYGKDVSDEFIVYAKYKLCGKLNIDLTTNEEKEKFKRYSVTLKELYNKNHRIEKNINTDKLKQRLASNCVFEFNCRNNDRFMEFAARYLAETNYFGKNAQFKMYQYFYAEDERNALEIKREKLYSKEFDKIHFHNGKQIYFDTYHNHLKRYPEWDMPFVIQNNAIFVKIETINHEKGTAFCIQRDLLTYLLEHALYSDKPEDLGKDLLTKYFKFKQKEYNKGIEFLNSNNNIDNNQKKTELKKIFPKRLLHQFCPPIKQNSKTKSTFEKYLEQAEQAEILYKEKKEQAEKDNTLSFFLKKNKGKQFKLRFIKKAWQLMYFREQYDKQKLSQAIFEKNSNISKNKEHEYGHHKKFNITREEYNDFSKWMFAFEDVQEYKNQLRELFKEKHFLENDNFKQLFESSKNLDDIYSKTKKEFKAWITYNDTNSNTNRFKIENYKELMEKGNVFINLTHFIDFSINNGFFKTENNKVIRPCLENAKYLYEQFYNTSIKKENISKDDKKIFSKLYKNRLEDCLLYEIAIQYLNADKTLREKSKNHLTELLTQDIQIEVKDIDNQSYTITIPFKDLEKFAQLQYFENILINKDKYRLLKNLPKYLNFISNNKEAIKSIKSIINGFNTNNNISLADLCLLNDHLITQQGRFTNCIMAMEEYFIWKNTLKIEDSTTKNRIIISDIPNLKDYFDENDRRNSAFHMNLPLEYTYKTYFIEKQRTFVKTEVKNKGYNNFSECPYMLSKTLEVFMNQMHDNIKIKIDARDSEEDKRKKRENAKTKFFLDILKQFETQN